MNPQKPYSSDVKGSAYPARVPSGYQPPGPYGPPPAYSQVPQQAPQPMAMPNVAPKPSSAGRLLHVYHEGWTHRHTQVMDSDKVTPIYTINSNSGGAFSSKPHMTILSAATGAVVGTVSFHQMSSDIDLEIHGRALNFTKPGTFSSSHQFQSLATGKLFKWKKDGCFSGGDLKCVDEMQQLVATFEISNWAMKKDGKFQIAPLVDGHFFDEVMVTGIAAMEYERRQSSSSSGGGGG